MPDSVALTFLFIYFSYGCCAGKKRKDVLVFIRELNNGNEMVRRWGTDSFLVTVADSDVSVVCYLNFIPCSQYWINKYRNLETSNLKKKFLLDCKRSFKSWTCILNSPFNTALHFTGQTSVAVVSLEKVGEELKIEMCSIAVLLGAVLLCLIHTVDPWKALVIS